MRRTDIQRDSKPASHQLYKNPEEKALPEARNGLLQFDEVMRLIDESKAGFKLKPSTTQMLQRLAIKDIYTCADNFRTRQSSLREQRIRFRMPKMLPGMSRKGATASMKNGAVHRLCTFRRS